MSHIYIVTSQIIRLKFSSAVPALLYLAKIKITAQTIKLFTSFYIQQIKSFQLVIYCVEIEYFAH